MTNFRSDRETGRRVAKEFFLCAIFAVLSSLGVLASPAAAETTRDAAMGAGRKLMTSTRTAAAEMSYQLAGQYISYLANIDAMLDSQGVTMPEDRSYFLGVSRDTIAGPLLASYDTFASATEQSWSKKLPALVPVLSKMLQLEREKLDEFLRLDPVLVLRAADSAAASSVGAELPPRMVMERAELADADEYAKLSFADKLRRAALAGDNKLRKVVRAEVGSASSQLSGQLSQQYETYLITVNRALDHEGVADTTVRRAILGPQCRTVRASMLAAYDAFAAKTQASFAGTTALIETEAAAVIAENRAALVAFLETDPMKYRQ